MAVNWALAGTPAGPLDLLRAAGQRQLEQVQLQTQQAQAKRLEMQAQREEQQFQRQQRIDQQRQTIGGQVAQGDLAGARAAALQGGDFEFANQIASLSKEQRAEAAKHAEVAASTLFDLRKLPAEQRAAAWESAKPALRTQGLDDEDFATIGADLSDNGINAAVSSVQSIGEKIKQATDERDYGFKVERAKAEDANAAAGRAVTMRGQDISAANSARSDARADRRQAMSDLRADRREALSFGKASRQAETDLRKEFDNLPEVKSFRTINGQGAQILRLYRKPSAQNDIAMIFSYMKMLDPNSVVREGEFATAQNAAGIPDRLRNLYNKAQDGTRLNPEQRRAILSSANDVKTSARQVYNDRASQFRAYASDYGASADRVAAPSQNKPKASAPVTIAPGFTIERVR